MNSLFAGYGHSWYDALQAKVERRFGSFQLITNYTWSKSLGYGHYRQVFGQGGSPGATPQDYNNVAESKSFMNMDIPHVFNVMLAYDLPFGKGKKWLGNSNAFVNAFVGGWTIASVDVYRKGTLIWLTTPGNPLGNGVLFAPATKANLGSGPNPDGHRPHDVGSERPEHALVQSGGVHRGTRSTRWALRRSTTTTSANRQCSRRTCRS